MVKRPNYVKVRAQDRNGKEFEIDGRELLAGPSVMNWTTWTGLCLLRG